MFSYIQQNTTVVNSDRGWFLFIIIQFMNDPMEKPQSFPYFELLVKTLTTSQSSSLIFYQLAGP